MTSRAARRGIAAIAAAGALAGAPLLAAPPSGASRTAADTTPTTTPATTTTTAPATTATTTTAPTTTGPARTAAFLRLQAKLEHRLAGRSAELARLSADVHGSATLAPADAAALEARLTAASGRIAALAAAVPTDTTLAELRAARRAMYVGNRVYAVLVPVVLDAVEASSITAQVATLQAGESSLQQSVTALAGEATYHRALRAYEAFVDETARATALSSGIEVRVLGQVPADYPRDRWLFPWASRHLLTAAVDAAHAAYDESLVSLAVGGTTS